MSFTMLESTPGIEATDIDDLSRFLIRSGVRSHCCVQDPQYRMPEPIPLETWERAGLRGTNYC